MVLKFKVAERMLARIACAVSRLVFAKPEPLPRFFRMDLAFVEKAVAHLSNEQRIQMLSLALDRECRQYIKTNNLKLLE